MKATVLAVGTLVFVAVQSQPNEAAADSFGAIAFMSNNDMLAVSSTGEAWISSNLGASWTLQGSIAGASGQFVGLLFIPNNDATAITDAGEVWTSGNLGVSWTRIGSVGTTARIADLVPGRKQAGGPVQTLKRCLEE